MRPIHRVAALTVASGVAVASLTAGLLPTLTATAVATVSDPAPTSAATGGAARYLIRHLEGRHHDHYSDAVGKQRFPDQGETADAVLSLDAAGVGQAAARRATAWLEHTASSYAGKAPNYFPGALAKLLLVAEAQHVNAHAFGGIDLPQALQSTEGAGVGTAPGQFQNPGQTDFGSSALVQSLAVLALADSVQATGRPDAAAVTFLLAQQCGNGGFQVPIRTNRLAPCKPADEDVDATAYAAQALLATGQHAAAGKAVGWLVSVEHSSGGWAESPGSPVGANSTAIAVEALIAAHHDASKGEAWLAGHQVRCSSRKARRGAVRFDNEKFNAAAALRATSQAGVALAFRSLSGVDRAGAAAGTAGAPSFHCSSKK